MKENNSLYIPDRDFKSPTPGDIARRSLAKPREKFLCNIPKNGFLKGMAVLYGQDEILDRDITVEEFVKYLLNTGDFEDVREEEISYGNGANIMPSRSGTYVIEKEKKKRFSLFRKG